MINFIKTFRNDEDGAVTVDWVVLTAAVVGLAIAAFTAIETGVGEMAGDIQGEINSQEDNIDTGLGG